MANCVKIKMNEKVMMLRSSTLTVGNLAMIFKLGMNQGIYICGEEEGEIIAPTETAFFNIEDPRSQGPLPHYLRHVIRLESPVLPENYLRLREAVLWQDRGIPSKLRGEDSSGFAKCRHAVNRAGQMKKGDKRSTFFYFDESGEKLE